MIPDTIPVSELIIQVGAFRNESYALALRDMLASKIDKPVSIVSKDGYHKVRITGFETAEEMLKLVPVLNLLGHRDIWILPLRRPEVPVEAPPAVIAPDTTRIPVEQVEVPVIEEEPAKPEPTVALQVAIFYRKSQALRAQRRITSKLGLPVEIVEQWGYYHVLVTGFFTREETYRFYPELAALGYPGVTLIENYKSQK
ncbi:MAG: SPOR domain-containing protein [Bacteroidales bacterium]|nr:SPOR domain-containing protein [Bacteroidales bacterium]